MNLTPEAVALGVVWYAVFLFSTTCHEAAHAWAGQLGGDPTAALGGQTSLNPLPHIQREPFGTVLVPIGSYVLGGWMIGWASAPYDPLWAERHPRRAGWMALAGPGGGLLLVLVAALGIRAGLLAGFFSAPPRATFTQVVAATEPGTWAAVATLASVLFTLNLLLFLFNLLPVPPLDGATGVTLLMSEAPARRFRDFTRAYGMAGLLLAWFFFWRLFDPAFTPALNLPHPGASYR